MSHLVIDARNRRSSSGRYTDRLVTHLQDIDQTNRYTVLVQKDDDWQMTNPNFKTVVSDFEQFSFNPFDQIKFAWQVYRLKPDMVHFTMTQQPLFYFGNIVTTTHDLTMLNYTRPSRFAPWLHAIGVKLYHFLFWLAHKKSKKIIVPTQYVADDLAKLQPFTKNKIAVTYESAEPPMKVAATPLKGVKKPFIFHVGAPLPHKNIDRLIQAFDLIKEKYPDLQLVLPGKMKPVFRESLDQWIAASKHSQDIIVPGFITDPELKWLYENAECYALPSLSEGFGLPGLEAMVHGCPLASSNATCLPEVYGDAALYFDPYDAKDMAAKITQLMDDKELQEKLVTAGKKQAAKYSWRKMAEETLAVYNDVI